MNLVLRDDLRAMSDATGISFYWLLKMFEEQDKTGLEPENCDVQQCPPPLETAAEFVPSVHPSAPWAYTRELVRGNR